MQKTDFIHWIPLLAFLFIDFGIVSQNNANQVAEARKVAQEFLAKLDQELNLGSGLVRSTFVLIRRNGNSDTWILNQFRNNDSSLYLVEKKGKGIETKILFREEGERIFVFNVLSAKLFRKNEEERYENLLNSGFSYVDLSGLSYQANYNPLVKTTTQGNENDPIRISLKPIIPYQYGKLNLLYDRSTNLPQRIDFHDKDGVLFKTLNIKYGPVKFKSNGVKSEKEIAKRLEMLDLSTGNIAVIEHMEVDRDSIPDPSLFEDANLSR